MIIAGSVILGISIIVLAVAIAFGTRVMEGVYDAKNRGEGQ